MPGTRYNLIAKANWNWLGPAYKGLDADLEAVEAAVAAGGGTGGGGGEPTVTDLTTVYNTAKA